MAAIMDKQVMSAIKTVYWKKQKVFKSTVYITLG